jgi:hypothetical protein
MVFGSLAGVYLAVATVCEGDIYGCDDAGVTLVWGATEALFVSGGTALSSSRSRPCSWA